MSRLRQWSLEECDLFLRFLDSRIGELSNQLLSSNNTVKNNNNLTPVNEVGGGDKEISSCVHQTPSHCSN